MLILVRHGESIWNVADRFAGSVDVALTDLGRAEARDAGFWLRDRDVLPSVAHSSLLIRARSTTDLILDACGASSVPVLGTDRLNERHYGALQGMVRSTAVERYGAPQIARWRRSVAARPPLDRHGRGESLSDVRARLRPYVEEQLAPALGAGHTVLVVSHGNALRMLVQVVEGLTDEQTVALELATGAPRIYDRVSGLPRAG